MCIRDSSKMFNRDDWGTHLNVIAFVQRRAKWPCFYLSHIPDSASLPLPTKPRQAAFAGEPVSYTHLDVYKRQVLEQPEIVASIIDFVSHQNGGAAPVSYTHLDVYKRQDQIRQHGMQLRFVPCMHHLRAFCGIAAGTNLECCLLYTSRCV